MLNIHFYNSPVRRAMEQSGCRSTQSRYPWLEHQSAIVVAGHVEIEEHLTNPRNQSGWREEMRAELVEASVRQFMAVI